MSLQSVPALAAAPAGSSGWTLAEVRTWPATIDVALAAATLGISRSWAYQLLTQGEFPCRTLRLGRRTRVLTASLVSVLEGGEA